MGLASIPFLVSIWTACISILKSIWDAAKSRILIVGVFFAKLASFVVKLLRNWVTYKYLLVAGLVLLFATTISSLLPMISYVFDISRGWQSLLDSIPGFAFLVWNSDGVMRLQTYFQGFVSPLGPLPVLIAGILVQIAVRAIHNFAFMIINAKVGNGK